MTARPPLACHAGAALHVEDVGVGLPTAMFGMRPQCPSRACNRAVPASDAIVVLALAHGLARVSAAIVLWRATPARGDGLARTQAMAIPHTGMLIMTAIMGVCLALLGVLGVALGATLIGVLTVSNGLASRAFGGVTGDVLGAIEQLVETVTLLFFATWFAADKELETLHLM